MANTIKRSSVESILGVNGFLPIQGQRGMSMPTVAFSLFRFGGAPVAAGALVGMTLARGVGLKSCASVSRLFERPYDAVVAAMISAMSQGPSGLTEALDTKDGACLRGTLPRDLFSFFTGTVEFDVIDKGRAGTEVNGRTMLPGQLVGFGKGKRALNAVLREVEKITASA